jgi:histidinol-phosphatase (PHP family)
VRDHPLREKPLIVDYHMHLRDPEERIEQTVEAVGRFVETAAARGVDEIGFTEHVYYFRQTREIWDLPYQTERCVYDLDVYCRALEAAKQGGFPVKLGLEVDFVGERQERLSELLAPYPWDFLLGSVHWLEGLPVDMRPGIWAERSVEDVWRAYLQALAALASSGAVDVLAHPDLAKIFGERPEPAVLAELHEEAAEAIAGAGVCIEISTAGLRKHVGELYPDRALLDACAARGVGITIASDAHVPRLVGEDFDQALSLARAAGCQTVTVFEGRAGRQEPLG